MEEFYEKFEDITGLANDGEGMSDREINVPLRMCPKGSRKTIYDNIYKMQKRMRQQLMKVKGRSTRLSRRGFCSSWKQRLRSKCAF